MIGQYDMAVMLSGVEFNRWFSSSTYLKEKCSYHLSSLSRLAILLSSAQNLVIPDEWSMGL